jgi:hypothetical protein
VTSDTDLATPSEMLDEVEEAFEREWWCWWMLRIEETDEEVDLRPRRPLLARRKVPRGVNGEGDNEVRLLGVVYIRGGGGKVELLVG